MSLLRRAVFMAAKRAAADPALQNKAREFAQEELEPRVREAVDRARPALSEAKDRVAGTARELRAAAREHSPVDDTERFLEAAGRAFRKRS